MLSHSPPPWSIVSFNVDGLCLGRLAERDIKLSWIIDLMKITDILCLQETHLDTKDAKWLMKWALERGLVYFHDGHERPKEPDAIMCRGVGIFVKEHIATSANMQSEQVWPGHVIGLTGPDRWETMHGILNFYGHAQHVGSRMAQWKAACGFLRRCTGRLTTGGFNNVPHHKDRHFLEGIPFRPGTIHH